MHRWFLTLLMLLALSTVGDVVFAATCTPIAQGACAACKNCKYCKHCKGGGTCGVCRK